MVSDFWDADGCLLVGYLPKGATIIGYYYVVLISKLCKASKGKIGGKLRKGVY